MLNPDRKEFGSQPVPAPENPRKNGHIPRWARMPAFVLRASWAILTATPGTPECGLHLPHIPLPDIRGATRWALIHWKPVGLSIAAIVGSGYILITPDRGPQHIPAEPTPASAALQSQGWALRVHPPDNPSSIVVPVHAKQVQSAEVKIAPPPEARIEPFDCGILSPETCATGEHVRWFLASGRAVDGIAFQSEKGVAFKIVEDSQVAATPGMIVAADAINRMKNSSIVSDSDQKVTVDLQYGFDQLQLVTPTPTPTETPQSPIVHKVKTLMCSNNDDKLCRGPLPGGKTGINLKAGQTVEISATGKLFLRGLFGYGAGSSCETAYEFDPDGKRYYQRTFLGFKSREVCPSVPAGQNGLPWVSLLGNIGTSSESSDIFTGSHWKGSFDRDGELWLYAHYSAFYTASGGYDITVTVYPTVAKKTEVVTIPTPQSSVTSITSTEKSSDLPAWLWGLGVSLLAGLAAYKLYEGRKTRFRKGSGIGTTTGTGLSVGSAPRIGGIAGILGDPSNPNAAPSTRPAQPKNPERITGQQEFEKRWQDAKSKLSPLRAGDSGNEHGYILERFKAGMGIVHEVSLDGAIRIPTMATRVRAGMEYLIPQIWPSNMIFKRFFDPGFNAGFLTPEDLAKILYLPEKYRNLPSFTNEQRRDIRRIRRVLMFALHPDTFQVDSDKSLQDSIDELLKKLNLAWSYVDKLIK